MSHDAARLDDFLITGRSLAEYAAFFALTEDDLDARILDCPGGAGSVPAELRSRGSFGVAVDPAYGLDSATLADLVREQASQSSAYVASAAAQYDWTFYGTTAAHAAVRERAAVKFLADHAAHPESYRDASLPELSFPDNAFDLALCSHLLFCYSDRIGPAEHVAALRELCRVAGQVRVYPLISYAGDSNTALLDQVLTQLERFGMACRVIPVSYRFQKGADHMLVIDGASRAH